MVADPVRPRIYTGGIDGLKMIDTDTFAVTQLLSGDQRWPLSISADTSDLLFVQYFNPTTVLRKIDLTSLELIPGVTIPDDYYITPALEGLDGRDYIAGETGVRQFDATTGALEQTFAVGLERPQIAMSPDRKTLFVVQSGTLSTYDISVSTPVSILTLTGTYFTPIPSPDGQLLYIIDFGGADHSFRHNCLI